MQHDQIESPMPADSFPTDPAGLPEASRLELLELADGDTLELRVGPVAKPLGDTTVRMLGYNGSIPGTTLKVAQGTEIVVHESSDDTWARGAAALTLRDLYGASWGTTGPAKKR